MKCILSIEWGRYRNCLGSRRRRVCLGVVVLLGWVPNLHYLGIWATPELINKCLTIGQIIFVVASCEGYGNQNNILQSTSYGCHRHRRPISSNNKLSLCCTDGSPIQSFQSPCHFSPPELEVFSYPLHICRESDYKFSWGGITKVTANYSVTGEEWMVEDRISVSNFHPPYKSPSRCRLFSSSSNVMAIVS